MIPARFAPILFGFFLSGMMSFLVSGLSTLRALGLDANFVHAWMGNWAISWAMAFPVVLIVAPITRRLVARLVTKG
jgi:uncharacterized membrane protein